MVVMLKIGGQMGDTRRRGCDPEFWPSSKRWDLRIIVIFTRWGMYLGRRSDFGELSRDAFNFPKTYML
jgi:hypothetical protein